MLVEIAKNPCNPRAWRNLLPDAHILEADTNCFSVLLDTVQALDRISPIDAVLTFSTYYVRTTAGIAAHFKLPHLNVETAHICHEKQLCRSTLRSAGLPVPAYWELSTEQDAATAASEAVFPCVIKPGAESEASACALSPMPMK